MKVDSPCINVCQIDEKNLIALDVLGLLKRFLIGRAIAKRKKNI